LGIFVTASGRLAHESTVLMSSCSALSTGVPSGPNVMAGSRNRSTTSPSRRMIPSSFRDSFICCQTSAKISSRVQSRAVLPNTTPGAPQFDTSTETTSRTDPLP
jgi:hypothetical protein